MPCDDDDDDDVCWFGAVVKVGLKNGGTLPRFPSLPLPFPLSFPPLSAYN